MRSLRHSLATALLTLLCVSGPPSQAEQAEQAAPIMPLASRSLLLDIATADQRLVVAGERGHILYSDDAGASWTQASVPTTQMLTGVHFINDTTGWAVGHDGLILASDDGGATWRVQRDGLSVQHQANLELREASIHQINALKGAIAIAPEDALADLELQLEDAELDLEDAELALAEPVHTAPLMDTWFQDAARGWAIGAFGTLVVTQDGGQHWESRGTA
ncbi:MAG: WD40/YVTN/BNR-like repeat-containing protein, partial [Halioglobus sp.]